jgi:hypothetical protein
MGAARVDDPPCAASVSRSNVWARRAAKGAAAGSGSTDESQAVAIDSAGNGGVVAGNERLAPVHANNTDTSGVAGGVIITKATLKPAPWSSAFVGGLLVSAL